MARSDWPVTVLVATALPGLSLAAAIFAEALARRFAQTGGVRFVARHYGRSVGEVDASFVRDILLYRPTVVGLSCFFWSEDAVWRFARTAKALRPETFVVVGGPQVGVPSDARAFVSEHGDVDAVLCGEADLAFAELCWRVARGDAPGPLKGLVTREGESSDEACEVEDLAEVPIAYRPGNTYVERNLDPCDLVALQTMRGCRRRCAYCLYGAASQRSFPLERVEAEIAFLCGRRVKRLRVSDAHFGGTYDRALHLLEVIAAHNIETRISLYPDPTHIDDRYVRAMERAGCEIVSIGAQSLDDDVLRRVRRAGHADEVESAVERCARLGTHCTVDMMVGLPGQTAESLAADVARLRERHCGGFLFSPLMLLPGTPLSRSAVQPCVAVEGTPQRFAYDESYGLEGYAALLATTELERWRGGFPRTAQCLERILGREDGERASISVERWLPAQRTAFLDLMADLDGTSSFLRHSASDLADRIWTVFAGRLDPGTDERARRAVSAKAHFEVLALAMHRRTGEWRQELSRGITRSASPVFWEDVVTRRLCLDEDAWLESVPGTGEAEDPRLGAEWLDGAGATWWLFLCREGTAVSLEEQDARLLGEFRAPRRLASVSWFPWPEMARRAKGWLQRGALVVAPEDRTDRPMAAGGDVAEIPCSPLRENAGPAGKERGLP